MRDRAFSVCPQCTSKHCANVRHSLAALPETRTLSNPPHLNKRSRSHCPIQSSIGGAAHASKARGRKTRPDRRERNFRIPAARDATPRRRDRNQQRRPATTCHAPILYLVPHCHAMARSPRSYLVWRDTGRRAQGRLAATPPARLLSLALNPLATRGCRHGALLAAGTAFDAFALFPTKLHSSACVPHLSGPSSGASTSFAGRAPFSNFVSL